MRTFSKMALVAGLALALVPGVAYLTGAPFEGKMVGKDCPDFTVSSTVNEAPALSYSEMKGEVVLVKYWGTK